MARPRKKPDTISEIIAKTPKSELAEMPLASLSNYEAYNIRARGLNKQLGLCRYPVKQCPIELHPKQRIIFNRNDQPSNPQIVYVYNEMIDYKDTLIPGKEYDLPICIVEYLSKKGTPKWKWFDNPDGSRETRCDRVDPRFALRSVY